MRAGARGFLLKDISLERLAEGIRGVAAGATLFRPALTERTRAAYEKPAAAPSAMELCAPLTSRETEILALMAAGFNNAEIAQALRAVVDPVAAEAARLLIGRGQTRVAAEGALPKNSQAKGPVKGQRRTAQLGQTLESGCGTTPAAHRRGVRMIIRYLSGTKDRGVRRIVLCILLP
eukprot:gene16778-19127_t